MKIRNTFLQLTFTFLSIGSYSQDVDVWSTQEIEDNNYYKGYVVEINNDTLHGFIRFSNRVEIQHEVRFFLDKTDRKSQKVFRPADLVGFSFLDKNYKCINYSGGMSTSAIKANLLLEEGCIEKYMWYEFREGYKEMYPKPTETDEEFWSRKYYSIHAYYNTLQRKSVDLDYFLLNREVKLIAFLKEDVELVDSIKKKELSREEIETVFEMYNRSCMLNFSTN